MRTITDLATLKTIKIPNRIYDRALKAVNKYRMQYGETPLKKLPNGVAECPIECPLAQAMGTKIYGCEGKAIAIFIDYFDNMSLKTRWPLSLDKRQR